MPGPNRRAMQSLSGIPLVVVTRGPLVESVHAVAACAVDAQGASVFEIGAVDVPVFLRSTAKPFIAAAIVRAGCADRFGFDDGEIAVMSASHNGEPLHVDAVRSILEKIGVTPAALRCGIHAPAYEPAAAALAARGERPSALHNNCSGKHAGILALAKLRNAPLDSYLERDHPAEAEILRFCERITGEQFGEDRLGVDGCGIPVYATSLRNAARSYARFATLCDLEAHDAVALERVRSAIVACPEMVGGTDRFDTVLARSTGGAIVGKAGAEGIHGSALSALRIGLVLKVIDGARRAAPPAAIALYRQLGIDIVDPELAAFDRVPLRNVAGNVVGAIAARLAEAR